MDKNTFLAIILCGIVIVGYAVVDMLYIMPKQQEAKARQQLEQQAAEEERSQQQQELSQLISSTEENSADSSVEQGEIPVKEYTITTDKVKVLLTNRGGDIVSYQLLEHLDRDTGHGVEMVDNVTSTNRAFSLAFGKADAPLVNDTFNVKVIDDYTIGFYRDFYRKDAAGQQHKFTLGKLYSFKPGDYVFKLSITIKAENGAEALLNDDGTAYTFRTSPQIGPHFDRKSNRYEVRQYLSLNGNKRSHPNFSARYYTKPYDWAGVAGKYFAMLVKPVDASSMVPSVKCSTDTVGGYENAQIFLSRQTLSQGNTTDEYYVYIGPRSEGELIKYNSSNKNAWGLINAKFNQALQTSGFLSVIEIALKWAMEMIYRVVHNWGVSIIILTIILKILLFPLNKKTAVGSLKMQELQPQMQALQEKYKGNQQKLSEETAKLYKQAGYNPVSGCLPMVLQMIVLFAMYNVFNNYFEFRGASFIPGWIDDLSVGDSVHVFKGSLPFLNWNTLRLLPIIYTISQLLNGVITQYGNPASAQTQSQMKFMMYGMPIMFFFLFYNVPSGLLLYWSTSNILQIGQQLVMNGVMKKKRAELAGSKKVLTMNTPKGGKKKKR